MRRIIPRSDRRASSWAIRNKKSTDSPQLAYIVDDYRDTRQILCRALTPYRPVMAKKERRVSRWIPPVVSFSHPVP
jgi:hypothetical protein